MLCAECLRCGRRSIIGRSNTLADDSEQAAAAPPGRLRCDMCGGRRVRLVRTDSPTAMIAFVAGRT
jgi:DNA-directed RNA polymerase subunit RPC12/RpoP